MRDTVATGRTRLLGDSSQFRRSSRPPYTPTSIVKSQTRKGGLGCTPTSLKLPLMKLNRTKRRVSTQSAENRDHWGNVGKKFPTRNSRDVVLDMATKASFDLMTKEIRSLGGRIVEMIADERPPWIVVSDHPLAMKLEKMRSHTMDPKQIPKELMKSLPLILREALKSRVRVRYVTTFQKNLAQFQVERKPERPIILDLGFVSPTKNATTKATPQRLSTGTHTASPSSTMGPPRALSVPFIKFEHVSQDFAPAYKEISEKNNVGPLYVGKYFGNSLFHKANEEQQFRRQCEMEKDVDMHCTINDENNDDEVMADIDCRAGENESPEIKKCEPPKGKFSNRGYCENCTTFFDNAASHFSSREHLSVVTRPGYYNLVDTLLGSFVDHITVPGGSQLRRGPSLSSNTLSRTLEPSDQYSEGCSFKRSRTVDNLS